MSSAAINTGEYTPQCATHAYWLSFGNNVAARQQAMHDCWSGLVGQYAWPSTTKVWSVMWCESKGDPTAHNPSGANGLMQEMGGPFDPAQNIARAWSQSKQGTYWKPWVCQ